MLPLGRPLRSAPLHNASAYLNASFCNSLGHNLIYCDMLIVKTRAGIFMAYCLIPSAAAASDVTCIWSEYKIYVA